MTSVGQFRFEEEHLYNLVDSLQLDEEQIFYNRLKVAFIEAFCLLLRRLSKIKPITKSYQFMNFAVGT